ncbi:MAG: hypothetical protein FGM55_08725, partial [Rhodoferax sp.]|nr:hypothetical protein [Rhodoferax sp.]
LMARGAVAEAFADAGAGLRLGWGRINKSTSSTIDGVGTAVIQAGVRELTPATRSAFFGWLQTLPASGGTPLPAALRAVGQYHARTDSRGPWADEPGTGSTGAEKSCRRAYHLLVTDGAWNAGTTPVGNADGTDGSLITGPGRSYQYRATRPYQDSRSDMLADYAMTYWKRDLRPDLPNLVTPSADDPAFWQHLVQMSIGLGVRGTLDPEADLPALTEGSKQWGSDEIDDLWHAALNSRGRYGVARDGPDLILALRQALAQVLRPQRFGGGVATASVALQQGNRRYQPVYRAGDWTGDVQAYAVDGSGQGGALVWSAEARLPAPGSRNIVTWRGDTRTPAAFNWAEMGPGNQAALGALAIGQGAELVDYLRGDRSREGEGLPFRVRNGRLGDMVNSNPVLVRDAVDLGYHALPPEQGGGPGYAAFLARKAARTPVVYVGANDGMLHGFRDTLGAAPAQDGVEVYAYVPRAVYPNLALLADRRYGTEALDHRFFVDGALTETDAHVPPPGGGGPGWRNLLLGSLGAGGRAVFAIDVTDPAALGPSSVRWELGADTQPDLGHLAAPVQAGVLPNGEWVAIFGNGAFSEAGRAVLFVVHLSTGSVQTLVLDAGGGNGLGGVALARNASGQVTSVYAGDLKGRLWRLDYQPGAASRFAVAGDAPLFQASTATGVAQPITQAPLVADWASGGRLLLVGTGVLATEADAQSTALQSVYGLRDQVADGLTRPLTRAQLAPRSLASVAGAGGITYYQLAGEALNLQTQRGWVIDLEGLAGLRVVHPLQRVGSRLGLVAAVAPARTVAPCETASGQGVTLLLPLESGLNPAEPVFDTNGDGLYTSADARVAGLAVPLGGAPALLKAPPVCASGVCATEASLQAPGAAQRIRFVEPAASTGERTVRDRVWRRILNPPIR